MKGFPGGISDGTYGYGVPEYGVPEYGGAYFRKVARLSLDTCGNVDVLDLTATDGSPAQDLEQRAGS